MCVKLILFFLFSSCLQLVAQPAPILKSDKHKIGDSAVVVTAHPLASRVGIEVLRRGGNAVDAAVAVQFALAVVYPRAGNIGGGGFMIYRSGAGDLAALDFREKAPALAHRDMYLDADGKVIPKKSLEGHLAAAVPGSVAGMYQAHQRYGRMAWGDLLQPAIDLAEQGVLLSPLEASSLNRYYEDFIRLNPSYLPALASKKVWKRGDTLIQQDLAWVLKRIQLEGAAGFYEGPVADSIVADMQRNGGLISHQDLKAYEVSWRQPLEGFYQGYRIITMPPPSSGGIALLQLLQSVEPYPLRDWGFQSSKAMHLMIEAERRVYADRAKHLGDADFYPVPKAFLLDTAYNRGRMANFDPLQATPSRLVEAGALPVLKREHEETTHFSIVDAQGNAVAITTTINTNYGSKAIVRGAGFLLNNEMDDFSAKAGTPNVFGLLGAEANAIEAGKRPLSSMTPTLVEREGRLILVLGTPGGSTIITSVFQVVLNVLTFDLGLKRAVHAPRFHHQWQPNEVSYERGKFGQKILGELRRLGHLCKPRDYIGLVEAIRILPNGRIEGVADNRAEDHVEAY